MWGVCGGMALGGLLALLAELTVLNVSNAAEGRAIPAGLYELCAGATLGHDEKTVVLADYVLTATSWPRSTKNRFSFCSMVSKSRIESRIWAQLSLRNAHEGGPLNLRRRGEPRQGVGGPCDAAKQVAEKIAGGPKRKPLAFVV